MKKRINLLIGILLCLIMVMSSMTSVMAEADVVAPASGNSAASEEAQNENDAATAAEGNQTEASATAEDKASAASDAQKLSTEKADRKVFKSAAVSAKEATDINIKIETNMPQTGWNLDGGTISVSESGIIMSRANAGSYISNGTINVDENAGNNRKAQQTESNGSVICAQTWGLLNLENLTIKDNAAKTMAVNLWQNSVVNFRSVNLDGNDKDWENTPVLLGDEGSKISFSSYDEDHTDSSIRNIQNAVIREIGSMSFGVERGSTLTIENSLLTYDGRGGDLVVSGTLTVKDSSLTLNNKRIVVKNGATLNITNSRITQTYNTNTAGIRVEPGGTLNISGSDLVNTWIRNNEGTVNITGIESDKSDLDKSDLDNCVIKNINSTLNISNSTLHNYKRTTAPNAEGGFDTMIHGTGSKVTLAYTEICYNENNYDKPSPVGTPGASIISLKGGSITMDNVDAHHNADNSDGGVMHTVDTNVTIKNSTFKNNSAKNQTQTEIDGGQWYAKGGALYIEDDYTTDVEHTTIIKDTTFEGNTATEGGAVFFKSDDQEYGTLAIDITVSTFKNNEARRAGGGLVIWGNGTTAELKGVKFLNNTAANFGGGMAVFFDSDPKGTIITALGKEPSEFVGNTVTKGRNFAGGGLFIDQAHVTMYDTAIYKNTAPHAGGGLSTCGVGTLEARVHDGVAIFDNEVSSSHEGLTDGAKYTDVYMRNINIQTDEQKDFPDYPYELYERMFNGGLHKWDKKEIEDGTKTKLVAKSDATIKDVSKAKVVFTENEVTATGNEVVSGGGIACNGLLTIGRGTELKAVKIWDDNNNNDGYRPDPNDEIDWIKIKADGEKIDLEKNNVEFTVIKGSEADDYVLDNNIAVIDENGKVTKFSEKYKDLGDNAWLIIIDGDFPRYRDVEKEGGGITHELINYTVEEDLAELGNKYSNTSRKGDMDSYFELTNSHVDETVEVAGQKTWDDNNNQRGDRPESITVTLFKNGVQVPDAVKTIGESNNWKWDFGEFPKFENGEKISYTVVENAVSDYSVSYNDFNVTNKYTPGMTSVTVVKNWEDKDDADGIRPSSVTVKLLANGKDTGKTLVLSKSNNWIGAFTDLYEKENGKAIVYTVSETAVKGYTSSVSGDQKTGYVITNKHKPKKNGAGSGSSKKGVRTGDANNVLPWIITLAAAAAILGAVIAKRRLNK